MVIQGGIAGSQPKLLVADLIQVLVVRSAVSVASSGNHVTELMMAIMAISCMSTPPVDAAFQVEVPVVDENGFLVVVAASPDCRAGAFEVHPLWESRAAFAVCVNPCHIDQSHVTLLNA